jgi:hypothetical protein
MLGENLVVRRVLAAFVIVMGVVGLLAVVALAVLLSMVGDGLDRMWTSTNDSLRDSAQTLRQSSDALDGTGGILMEMERSNAQSELPALRGNLNGISREMTVAASSLASAEESSEGLRQSGLFFWIVVVLLGYFGALALAMIIAGVLFL